ncbi:hypothetical protein [Varibaculum vaginae]|uniref:hypothetical protein n=1 Tax=Varibaculum vaginae TaxID=2364797 RepID=UPI000F08DE33|nr:hypothetical protein [Varibaculum vaginae]
MNNLLRRYWLPLVLVIVGSIVALCGVGTVTIWKPSPQVSVSLPSAANKQTMAITRPGMFELYDSPTKITVSGQGKVALAIGRATDVTAWAADQNYVEVTGQKDQNTLLTEPHSGKAKARQPGEAAGKDMWVKYKEVKGGQISETWNRSEGAWSAIAWSEEGNVQLTLHWTQAVSTPWFWPLLIAGLVLVLVGALVALVINRLTKAAEKEEAEVRERRRQRAEQAARAQTAQTVELPSLDAVAHPPSRSALRKARERGEATIEVDGVKFPTGLVPVIRTDADGQAINPEAADSSASGVPATNELSFPTMPAAELPLTAQSPQTAAHSPLPEADPEVSFDPDDSAQSVASNQPETSYNPAGTYPLETSQDSATSYQPSQSHEPQISYNPAQSSHPTHSYEPQASYNPADSYQPALSPQPAQSYQPEASYHPADSYQPEPQPQPSAPVAKSSDEWFEDDNFDLDGLGEGPDIEDFEGESTFDQSQGGQQ